MNLDHLNHDLRSLYSRELVEKMLNQTPIMAARQTQLFTPPSEGEEGPLGSAEQAVSVSSVFYPGSHETISDTILRSSDGVLFYISSKTVLSFCKNTFEEFLGTSISAKRFRDGIIDIPESSAVLDIIVHSIYQISVAKHSPTFDDLETAVNRMPVYGLVPKKHILPSTPLCDLLLSYAPLHPIRVYTLAGHFDIEELAVKASGHLLSYDLSGLSDDVAKSMGAIYLRRLMCLHYNLIEALKATILRPPRLHPLISDCDFNEQNRLSRAWALTASYLAWDSKPDTSISAIRSAFAGLGDRLECDECKKMLRDRVKEVVLNWLDIKRTI